MLQEGRPDVGFEPLAAADDPVQVGCEVTNSFAPGGFGNHGDGLGGESCPDLVGELLGGALGTFRDHTADAGFASGAQRRRCGPFRQCCPQPGHRHQPVTYGTFQSRGHG